MTAILRTDDLTPRQINMLVAVAEGWVPPSDPLVREYQRRWQERNLDGRRWPRVMWLDDRDITEASWHGGPFSYCADEAFAGRIIDRELIATAPLCAADGRHDGWGWDAKALKAPRSYIGPTRLQAAMRAYVAQVHGEWIDTTDKPWLLEAVPA